MQNKELIKGLRKVNDNLLVMGILGNLPPEHYTFHHLGFNFACCQLNKKYPRLFGFYFRTINAEEKTCYSKQLEDIKFMLGSSGVMSTVAGRRCQYMNIDGKMVNVLQKNLTKDFTKEQINTLKILSKDFVGYLKEYSN